MGFSRKNLKPPDGGKFQGDGMKVVGIPGGYVKVKEQNLDFQGVNAKK